MGKLIIGVCILCSSAFFYKLIAERRKKRKDEKNLLAERWMLSREIQVQPKHSRVEGNGVRITALDETMVGLWTERVFRFDAVLDDEVILKGLEKALSRYPQAAGRLERRKDSGRFEIVGSQGAIVQIYHHSGSVTPCLPDSSSSSEVWESSGLFPVTNATALVQANILHCNDVTFVSVRMNHALVDGRSFCDFMICWSNSCASNSITAEPHTSQRPHDGLESVKSLADLHRLDPKKDVGFSDPSLTRIAAWRFTAALIWRMALFSVVEFRVNSGDLLRLRKSLNASVSTFETFYGILLPALAFADEISNGAELPVSVLINIRGRSTRYCQDYFGNAVTLAYFPFKVPDLSSERTVWIKDAALQIQNGIKAWMKKNDDPDYELRWMESAKKLGVGDQLWSSPMPSAFAGNSFVLNWSAKYPWFDVRLGGDSSPSAFYMASTCVPRYSAPVPVNSQGDLLVRFMLPSQSAVRFHSFATTNNLPFHFL